MHRHRHRQGNPGLESVRVGPGSETGLYYITVSNLAHRTTWQDLKAFAGQVCEVDHAGVYNPTCGFVRVRGRDNFEKAFKHLEGNTLEYRALQADARNKDQETIVLLPPTDYHAARIRRGHRGRVFTENGSPVPEPSVPPAPSSHQDGAQQPQGESPILGHPSNVSPAISTTTTDTQWVYVASLTYVSPEGYQAVVAPGPGLVQQGAISTEFMLPQPMIYQAVPGTQTHSAAQHMAHPFAYGSDPSAAYHLAPGLDPSAQVYVSGQSYAPSIPAPPQPVNPSQAGFIDAWQSEPTAPAPIPFPPTLPIVLPHEPDHAHAHAHSRRPLLLEQRRIILLNLQRDGLSEAAVRQLLANHTVVGMRPEGVERVELPYNREGRPRGTAFVTFGAVELATAAVAALDGRVVGGRRLGARLAEGVVMGGYPVGGDGRGLGRRGEGGGGSGKGGGGGGGGGSGGRSARSSQGRARFQSQGQMQTQTQAQVQTQQQQAQQRSQAQSLQAQVQPRSQSQQSENSHPQPAGAVAYAPGPRSDSVSSASSGSRKEERPVIVDGSRGRWKKETVPAAVGGVSP